MQMLPRTAPPKGHLDGDNAIGQELISDRVPLAYCDDSWEPGEGVGWTDKEVYNAEDFSPRNGFVRHGETAPRSLHDYLGRDMVGMKKSRCYSD